MGSPWRFLVDECMEPKIARLLRREDIDAQHVQDIPDLGKGADDVEDILPYVRREDVILVTNNFHDFDDIQYGEHEGILLDYDGTLSAQSYATASNVIEAYPGRDLLRHREPLDDWVHD